MGIGLGVGPGLVGFRPDVREAELAEEIVASCLRSNVQVSQDHPSHKLTG